MTGKAPTPPPPDRREIKDENGDLMFAVWEEHPGTVFATLRCQSRTETRETSEYPPNWRKLTDRQLHRLCRAAPLVDDDAEG